MHANRFPDFVSSCMATAVVPLFPILAELVALGTLTLKTMLVSIAMYASAYAVQTRYGPVKQLCFMTTIAMSFSFGLATAGAAIHYLDLKVATFLLVALVLVRLFERYVFHLIEGNTF